MKTFVNICRAFVGVLFIFSGLVKANDPTGLSLKMQEFFDIWGMSFMNNYSLWIAVLMIAFEIIAGVALLLGWKKKLVSWLLLLLIVFFTFLTGYAYLSGKFKTCGCLGDCIPIPSGASFTKDIILLVLILFLFFNQKYIQPLFSKLGMLILLLLSTVFSFAGQWYTLHYLPVVDCLPFKVGNSIPQKMKVPADAVPDSTVINFVYEKNGKKVEFTADNFPDDFSDSVYKFISRKDKVIKPGKNNTPDIKGFDFTDKDGNNVTQNLLQQKYTLLLFLEDMDTPFSLWKNELEKLVQSAISKGITVYTVTSMRAPVTQAFASPALSSINILDGDHVLIKTAARTNPTIYLLQQGIILNKWSYKDFGKTIHAVSLLHP
jgi:uncharacterized membrane protein YphA (DoxX/SURF4 family)